MVVLTFHEDSQRQAFGAASQNTLEHLENGNNLGTKPGAGGVFLGPRLPQRQSNHQAVGGSVWESNPPFGRRAAC